MNQAEHDMLVMDAQQGSRRAFGQLVRHHQQNLLRFAYSLCGESALAQDAVQDAWIKVAKRLRRLDDPRAFRGWIYHSVRWRVVDLQRKSHRSDLSLEDRASAAHVSETQENDNTRDRRDTRMDLASAMDQLPAIEQQALQLFYVSGLTVNEIAVVLKIPSGTVKSRLHRARRLLKEHFQGDRA